MNDWRENLHTRGGDPDNPGRFSKGHGGRYYNSPPGLEHLALQHDDGGKRLEFHEKTHMNPAVTDYHAENLRAAVIERGKGKRKDEVELDRLIKWVRHHNENAYKGVSTKAKKRTDILASRLSALRAKMAKEDQADPVGALVLLKKETDRVNNEGRYRHGTGGLSNKRGTDSALLEAFEKNAFHTHPRDRNSGKVLADNSWFVNPIRAGAKKWFLGAVNFNIHHKAMSLPMFYSESENGDRQRASCGFTRGEVPYHHRLSDGSSVVYDFRVPANIDMGVNNLETTYIHEYGHAIEGYNSEASELCRDFLKSRRAPGEKLKKMSDLSKDFDPHEVGFDDKFARVFRAVGFGPLRSAIQGRYTGKDYGFRGGTEVLSKGMELLYKDPAAFAKADPEWFNLVVGILTGNSLVASRHNLEEDRHKAEGGK